MIGGEISYCNLYNKRVCLRGDSSTSLVPRSARNDDVSEILAGYTLVAPTALNGILSFIEVELRGVKPRGNKKGEITFSPSIHPRYRAWRLLMRQGCWVGWSRKALREMQTPALL